MAEETEPRNAIIKEMVKRKMTQRKTSASKSGDDKKTKKRHKSRYETFLNPTALRHPDWLRPKLGRPRATESLDVRRARFIREKRKNELAGRTVRNCIEQLQKEVWQQDPAVKELFALSVAQQTLEQSISRGLAVLGKSKKLAKNSPPVFRK